MTSAAQIAANRANAQNSTGPKTEAGKAASSRNALKHGLCAEQLLIDGEEAEAFEELRADYAARLRPVGAAEARLADRIAQVAWRRERGSVAEAAAWRGHARGGWILDRKEREKQRWEEDADETVGARVPPIMNGAMAELLRITLYEGRLTRELQRLEAELKRLQDKREAAAQAAREARASARAWAAGQAMGSPVKLTEQSSDADFDLFLTVEKARGIVMDSYYQLGLADAFAPPPEAPAPAGPGPAGPAQSEAAPMA